MFIFSLTTASWQYVEGFLTHSLILSNYLHTLHISGLLLVFGALRGVFERFRTGVLPEEQTRQRANTGTVKHARAFFVLREYHSIFTGVFTVSNRRQERPAKEGKKIIVDGRFGCDG